MDLDLGRGASRGDAALATADLAVGDDGAALAIGTADVPATAATPAPLRPAFAGTGPQGHRGRMRDRLLAHGAEGLADYELLEMLLFLAIPRRDTKPLAKDAINRLGGLAGVLEARPADLRGVPGMTRDCAGVFRLVRLAADRLAGADARERPLLNTWDRLVDYLDAAPSDAGGGGGPPLRVLYLDGRNRLLADEPWDSAATDPEGAHREALGRALDLHATALLTLRDAPLPPRRAGLAADAALAERLRAAGAHLSVVLHDHLLGGRARWTSLRRQGLM